MLVVGCSEKKQEKLLEAAETKLAETKYSETVEILRKVISLNPENKLAIKAMYKLGFVLETYARDYPGAIFNYQEAIRLSQDPVSVYEIQKRVANIFFEQIPDSEKAIEAYRKLLSFSPGSLEADFFQFRVAESFFKQNNFEQARTDARNWPHYNCGSLSCAPHGMQSRVQNQKSVVVQALCGINHGAKFHLLPSFQVHR